MPIHASTARSFKLTVGTEDLKLNHRIILDKIFLINWPDMNLVDEGTHFTNRLTTA